MIQDRMIDAGIRPIVMNNRVVDLVTLPYARDQQAYNDLHHNMQSYIKNCLNLYVFGSPSSGRSTICTFLAKRALDLGMSVGYYQAFQFAETRTLTHVRVPRGFSDPEVFFEKADLIVIEDAYVLKYLPDSLYRVIEKRYNNRKSLIFSGLTLFSPEYYPKYDVAFRQGLEDSLTRMEKGLGIQWPYRIAREFTHLFTGACPYLDKPVYTTKGVEDEDEG